jgi:5-methylcytosine-specific restriction endonuclease McrA
MPTDGPPLPDPKARTLARGPRKYRRKVASPKQWQALAAEKLGPCRVCVLPGGNGHGLGYVQYHHVVSREDHGDDCADNIVPLHEYCHGAVTRRVPSACLLLLESLDDAEYAYMIQRGGEGYPERAYGIKYRR